jgi:stage II sporulation protein D
LTILFGDYLEGIAEVPASWPTAALEAQAIAARSYALATTGVERGGGEPPDEPICLTSACQVYGDPAHALARTRRWYGQRLHAGEVLLFEGRPPRRSTSRPRTGRPTATTRSSAARRRCRPAVVEDDDGASPSRAGASRIALEDLARFLAAAERAARPRSRTRLDGRDGRGPGGAVRSMDLSAFRDAVNAWAHCLEPRRYPPGSLPTTIPSRWLSLSSGGRAVTVTGRGWGHGAGMVQWGAYGKALRGLSASEILAFYYGGFRPSPYPEPGLIHVQIASGLTSIRLEPSGAGATLDGEELGRGRVVIAGGDALTVRT